MTDSELKFERFCAARDIPFKKIQAGHSTTPDYEIVVNSQKIVVEVKEIDLNDNDKKALQQMETKTIFVWGSGPVGNRVRYKIDDAKRQLESRAMGICPSILVLYDKRPQPVGGIFSYEILVAMYGCETIELHMPSSLEEPLKFGKHRFGNGKKFRPGVHTYISGLAVLSDSTSNSFRLDVYVNDFADKPLPYEDLIRMKNVYLFVRQPKPMSEFNKWARLITDDMQNSEPWKGC
jgi:hypothetical protein